jgi:ribonuclease III
MIKKIFKDELAQVSPDTSVDYKTLLQEKLQAQRLGTPQYRVTKTEGLPHARRFSVEASWETGRSSGQGSSIKSAEMMAAQAALEALNGSASELEPPRAGHRIADQHNE